MPNLKIVSPYYYFNILKKYIYSESFFVYNVDNGIQI